MIRGTNHDQDARFSNKTEKMLTKSTWPDKYDTKVDLSKIDYELIKIWVQKRVTKLLGEEDDIASGTIISHLDESIEKEEKLNAKLLHVAISGVLQDHTLTFMSQFWDILDEAQKSSRGIPECLIEEKKKGEQTHMRKLDDIRDRRHKMNVNRFNQDVREDEYRRDRKRDNDGRRERDNDGRRERESEPQKKKKNRERSRSRSHHKKHRERSREKKRRERSRQKQSKKQKSKRKYSRESRSPAPKKSRRREPRESSIQSDSSGVVSSSSSN